MIMIFIISMFHIPFYFIFMYLEISCGFPPAYDDVELVGDDFQDAVTLRCHDVDANVTSNIDISCQTNGQWNLESWISCSLGTWLLRLVTLIIARPPYWFVIIYYKNLYTSVPV